MNNRRHEEEPPENSERWMLTYLDMITLLMIFFVVLYSMSSVNEKKFSALATQFGIVMGGNSVLPNQAIDPSLLSGKEDGVTGDGTGQISAEQPKELSLDEVEKQITDLIEREQIGQYVTGNLDERGVVISMRETLVFELGSAEINENVDEVLGKIANIIANTKNFIRVEGFTDDLPISTWKYKSNWELASQRAVNVVDKLTSMGLDPSRISAMSYGEYRPIVPNTSEENRKRNRRVDIVVINKQYDALEPGLKENQ